MVKDFPLRTGTRQGCPFSSVLVSTVLETLVRAVRQGKQIKGIQFGTKEVKQSLFIEDMVVYVKNIDNMMECAIKQLELVSGFRKVAGYNINIQKSIIFQFTSNKLLKVEIF